MPTPAGWYPDPEQSGQQIYWGGQQWTEHRAPLTPTPPAPTPPRRHPFALVSALSRPPSPRVSGL
ncbi:MAG: DUF2510 domain-containing protein [Actinomycetia bacterium]|nr:DUF2510 domain-containing protein [Actinomycetes bacterium]